MGRGERIIATVSGWPGVTTGTGRFGETDLYVEGRSIGHVHGDVQADIPYPRGIRDELVAAGRAEPHHVHPESTWITRYIRSDDEVDDVIDLFRINYERVRERRQRSA